MSDRTDRVAVIAHPDYALEVDRLAADPIIQAMAAELPDGWDAAILDSWGFIQGASHEYDERGGKDARSIGGPAAAVKRVYLQRQGTTVNRGAW